MIPARMVFPFRNTPLTRRQGTVASAIVLSLLASCASAVLAMPAFESDASLVFDTLPGVAARALASGDLDGDGLPDAVETDFAGNNVAVLKNVGGGAFTSLGTVATGVGPRSVVLADMNGDGKRDLVVANSNDNGVSVHLGNGSGGFAAPTLYAMGSEPRAVAVADINADGRLDLVTANYASSSLSVRTAKASGGFNNKRDYVTSSGPASIAVGDLNGDGRLDLVSGNVDGSPLSYFLGSGNGQFGSRTDLTGVTGVLGVAVGDVNGDGRADIVDAQRSNFSSVLQVRFGLPGGGFANPVEYAANYPTSVLIADVDGDGLSDLVATENYEFGPAALVLYGTGAGAFERSRRFTTLAHPVACVFADVTSDGRRDLLVAEDGAGMRTMLGRSDGALGGYARQFTVNAAPGDYALGDLNGDGRLDVAAAGYNNVGSVTCTIALGQAGGALGPPTTLVEASAIQAAIGDLNRDGKLDVVFAENTPGQFGIAYGSLAFVRLGNGDGTFAAAPNDSLHNTPYAMALADFDRDGILDIVAAVASLYDRRVVIRLGNGDGTFRAGGSQAVPTNAGPGQHLAVGDLDGDGDADVIVVSPAGNAVLLGIGDGTLGIALPFNPGARANDIEVEHLDADPHLDAVVADNAGAINVLRGHGDGTFDAPVAYATIGAPSDLALSDLDRDGRLDVVCSGLGKLSIFMGNGDGTLAPRDDLATLGGTAFVQIADMDGDAWPDLVFGSSGGLSILRQIPPTTGVGSASEKPLLNFAIAPNPTRGAVNLTYTLPREAHVHIELLDVSGRHIATLAHGARPAGTQRLRWAGSRLRPGVYMMRLDAGRATVTRRMVWVE